MLYHWYELDLEIAAPTGAAEDIVSHSATPTIHYNATTAIAHANGAPYRLNELEISMKPANDQPADKVVIRLREAGLGLIGEPRQRARPDDYAFMRQMGKLCQSTTRNVKAVIFDGLGFLTQLLRPNDSGCSHRMVSNSTDDKVSARDGAQGQRFNASIG